MVPIHDKRVTLSQIVYNINKNPSTATVRYQISVGIFFITIFNRNYKKIILYSTLFTFKNIVMLICALFCIWVDNGDKVIVIFNYVIITKYSYTNNWYSRTPDPVINNKNWYSW